MGDPACWLSQVCDGCGQVVDRLDDERRCPTCRAATRVEGVDATAITLVSQLITDARSRWGADRIDRVDVPADVLDEAMDHVLHLGGTVVADGCTVEDVAIRELPADADGPRAWVTGEDQPRPLTRPDATGER